MHTTFAPRAPNASPCQPPLRHIATLASADREKGEWFSRHDAPGGGEWALGAEMKLRPFWAAGLLGTTCLAFYSGCHGDIDTKQSWVTPETEELARALSSRPFEARLVGGFPHDPCRSMVSASTLIPRSRCGDVPFASPQAIERASRLERLLKAEQAPTKANLLHTRGLFQLVLAGDEQALLDSILLLETALARIPHHAGLHSDLAAAHLRLARFRDDPVGLLRALSLVEEALLFDQDLPEAHFNRALLLELLAIKEEACAAWHSYLAIDATSPWAEEARQHLDVCTAAQDRADRGTWNANRFDLGFLDGDARHSRRSARRFGENEFLLRWATAIEHGRWEEAEKVVELSLRLGRALASSGGSALLLHTALDLDSAMEDGNSQRLKSLQEGLGFYSRSIREIDEYQFDEALQHLEESRRALAAARSPFVHRASFAKALCLYNQRLYSSALAMLEPLETTLKPSPYPAVRGRVRRLRGLVHASQGRLSTAITAYETALDDFQRAAEPESTAGVETLIFESLDKLGETRRAWRHGYRSLTFPAIQSSPRVLYNAFDSTALAARELGEIRTALHLVTEQVNLGRRIGHPLYIEHALARRAIIRAKLAQWRAARRDLEEAKIYAAAIEDPAVHERAWADLALGEGKIELERTPARAAELLDHTRQIHLASGYRFHLPGIYSTLATAHTRLGNPGCALEHLEDAITELEWVRSQVVSPDLRGRFFDRERAVFDQMIELQSRTGESAAGAFQTVERAQARVLLDLLDQPQPSGMVAGHGAAEPLATEEILDQRPQGTLLLAFRVLDRQLHGWVLFRGRLESFSHEMDRTILEERVQAFSKAVREREIPKIEMLAGELYELLLAPIQTALHGADHLVIVPDGPLHGIPFAALRSPRTGSLLVEEISHSLTPSASLFMRLLARRPASPSQEPRVLVVGDPAFDRVRFPTLDRLPSAALEAKNIAHRYLGAHLLLGQEAHRENVLTFARQAEILHFGGHGRNQFTYPQLSSLLLAPHGEDDGVLYAHEVTTDILPRARLVVLASCGGADGPISHSEGAASLARVLLAAGVPTVVASLWPLDDRSSFDFFTAFHRRIAAGETAAKALRAAQLERLLAAPELATDPLAWAPIQVLGKP